MVEWLRLLGEPLFLIFFVFLWSTDRKTTQEEQEELDPRAKAIMAVTRWGGITFLLFCLAISITVRVRYLLAL